MQLEPNIISNIHADSSNQGGFCGLNKLKQKHYMANTFNLKR